MERVSRQEVVELLRRVGAGEVEPRLVDAARPWWVVDSGNIAFDAAGWRVEIFKDYFEWDYVDRVVAPDGREGEFEDWAADAPCRGPSDPDPCDDASKDECLRCPESRGANPGDALGREVFEAVHRAFAWCLVAVDGTRAKPPPMSKATRAYVLAGNAIAITEHLVRAVWQTAKVCESMARQDWEACAEHVYRALDNADAAKRIGRWSDAIHEAGAREP